MKVFPRLRSECSLLWSVFFRVWREPNRCQFWSSRLSELKLLKMQATSPGRGNRSTAWKNVCLAAKLPKRGRFFSFVTSCIIGWWIHGPEARKCSPNVDACAEFNFCSKIETENRLERLSNQIWNPKERIERTTYRRKWGELTTVKFCRVACRSIQVQKLLFPEILPIETAAS